MVFQRVKKVIAEDLGADEGDITPNASLRDDLNADSLDLVELILALEEEFTVELRAAGMESIPDADAERMQTVQDIVSYIEGKERNEP